MRKVWFILLLVTFLVIVPISTPQSAIQEGVPASPSSLMGGGGASEDEDIDTFNVNPTAGRWDATYSGMYVTVTNSILKMYGTGDGSTDYAQLVRELQDTDDKVIILFYVTGTGGAQDTDNYFKFQLLDRDGNNPFTFLMESIYGSGMTTKIQYYGSTTRSKTISANDSMELDTWYLLTMDYDLPKSQFSFEVEYENGTDLFSYEWTDIYSDDHPTLFASDSISILLRSSVQTSAQTVDGRINYIDAPFAAREWYQETTPSDSDFYYDHWDMAKIQEWITNDQSCWRINVPYFDSCSGIMTVHQVADSSAYEDEMNYRFTLYAVDGDDAGIHKLGSLRLQMIDTNNPGGNALRTYAFIEDGNDNEVWEWSDEESKYGQKLSFAIGMSETRTSGSIKASVDLDIEGTTWDWSPPGIYEFDVSDYADDPSSEFILEVDYEITAHNGNSEIEFALVEFDMIERNIFQGVVNAVQGLVQGIVVFFVGIFALLFRFLAGIFRAVGDIIVKAVDALAPLITSLQSILDDVWNLIDEIAGWATGVLNDIFEEFAKIGEYVWEWIESVYADVASWLQDVLEIVIPAILGFLGTIVTTLLEFGWAIWYGLWEAVGLEGVFEIGDLLFTGLLQFLTNLPQFILDWTNFLQVISSLFAILGFIWIFCLPLAIADSAGGFVAVMLDHMFTDLSGGLSILGFRIPIPFVIPWALVTIFSLLGDTIYFGFFG